MGGGGVRSEETRQPAGRTRGTTGDGRNEGRRQMGGGGVRRGNATTSRTRGLEGRDEWPELSVDTVDGSLMARYGATAPRRQWTALDSSSTARDSTSAAAMDREHNSNGRRWAAGWQIDGDGRCGATAMDGTTATQ